MPTPNEIPPAETPSENLSPFQTYGQYHGNPSNAQLESYFEITAQDRKLIASCRSNITRLGMAVQICTLRFLDTFLEDLSTVPEIVVQHLEQQLGFQNTNLEAYCTSKDARLEHQKLIVKHYGYREFDGAPFLRVARMLLTKLSVSNEPTKVLVDAITSELEGRNVILPSIKRITKLISNAREHTNMRLYEHISKRLSSRQADRLGQLFNKPNQKDAVRTNFELLRNPPMHASSISLQRALERVERLREVGVVSVNLEDIAENRLEAIVRHGLIVRAADLEKYSLARRLATLVVMVQHLERSATDDALVIFDQVMHETGLRGQKKRQLERLRTLSDLDAAAMTLKNSLDHVTGVLRDSSLSASNAREAALAHLEASRLIEAKLRVIDLVSSAENEETEIWENAHRAISPFLLDLITTIKFEGTSAMKDLLEAIAFVKRTAGTSKSTWGEIPRAFIPSDWLGLIFATPKGITSNSGDPISLDETEISSAKLGSRKIFKRHHYLVCVAHKLHLALKSGDVFVRRSNQHDDPRAQMLDVPAWNAVKVEVLASLGLNAKPDVMLARWSKTLDETYKTVAKGLAENPMLRLVVRKDGDHEKTELIITPFEALPESESLTALKSNVDSRLPQVALSELLLEINARTNFAAIMVQGVEQTPHAKGIELSVLAVLLAEACNIGLSVVADESIPALTLWRLNWVKKNYVHADTITQANTKLVEYHSSLPITQRWGGGEIASADGIRFVVPVKTIHAGRNPKYFGTKKGITYYTLVSDQFTQLHGQVIAGTMRDSLFILAALLEQQTNLRPRKIMADTGAYSDVIFGLFFLLGYKFSPRIKDVGGSRYWRINRDAKYGDLNDVARHKINTNLIVEQWDDVLRLIGSIKLGKIKAVNAMRVLTRSGSLNGIGRAVQEIGRIAKTLFLLEYVNDEATQRQVHLELTHHETRHSMARVTAHGNQGEIRQHYKKGMEEQLGALGLVVNIAVLWNTLYTQAALELITAMGDEVLDEDVVRLSPLKWAHINLLGRYEFSMDPMVAGGDLRPLRDPNAFRGLEAEA